jgi:hypothetical protein
MKYHIKPSDNELVMREDDFIVSILSLTKIFEHKRVVKGHSFFI